MLISQETISNLPSTPVRKKLSISNESCTAAAALASNGLIVVAIKEAAVINDESIIISLRETDCNDVDDGVIKP